MESQTQLLPDVLRFFAASAAPPFVSVPRFYDDVDHPLSIRLREQFNAVDESTVDRVLVDPSFRFMHSDLKGVDLTKKAREWHIIAILDREILRLRRRLLSEQFLTDRPAPYDHPALADLRPTDDYLVPIRDFEFHRGGALVRSGFAFSIVPVTESVNASYWLTQTLAKVLQHNVFVRLDPLLVCRLEEYCGLEYKMLVYGRALDWDRLVQLREEEHGRWQPGPLTRGVDNTDFVWSPRGGEVHFQCEELLSRERALGWGCRYFHAIFDRGSRKICHLDGALRFMTNENLEARQSRHLRLADKVGTRVKVFRSDVPVEPECFSEVTPQFFVWNYDVARYFGNDFPIEL